MTEDIPRFPSRPIAYTYMSHVYKVHKKEVKLLYCQPRQQNEIFNIKLLQTTFTLHFHKLIFKKRNGRNGECVLAG